MLLSSYGAKRESRLDAILRKKKNASAQEKKPFPKKDTIPHDINLTKQVGSRENVIDEVRSLKQSTKIDQREAMIELKPGFKIPRPTRILNYEELLDIVKAYEDYLFKKSMPMAGY